MLYLVAGKKYGDEDYRKLVKKCAVMIKPNELVVKLEKDIRELKEASVNEVCCCLKITRNTVNHFPFTGKQCSGPSP